MTPLFSNSFEFVRGDMRFLFHEDGSLCRIDAGGCLISSMVTSPVDRQIGEIILRLWENGSPVSYPLTGRRSMGTLYRGADGFRLHTEGPAFSADVSFFPTSNGWIWQVNVQAEKTYDLLYMQDIGLADLAAQRTNELYTAQYLAHHVRNHAHGVVIASRQNMPQSNGHPCLWQGLLEGQAIAFATDGTQYFGSKVRSGSLPEAYETVSLPSEILQGESACISLQTDRMNGHGKCTFFALYQADHADIIRDDELPDLSPIQSFCNASIANEVYCPSSARQDFADHVYTSPCLNDEQINELFPERELEEKQDGKLLSFFLHDHKHIVLQPKELLCSRPHATVMTTLFQTDAIPDNLLTSTAYMYGNFACQTVIGSTSLHKLNSVNRGLYDFLSFGGTRLWIKLENSWYRLGLPAAFTMDVHSAVWTYILQDDLLTITAFTQAKDPVLHLTITSQNQRTYQWMMTMRTVMGEQEFDQPFCVSCDHASINLSMAADSNCRYPDLAYQIIPSVPFQLHRDDIFFTDAQIHDQSLLTLIMEPCSTLDIAIGADLYGQAHNYKATEQNEAAIYHRAYGDFLNDFSLKIPHDFLTEQRIGHTVWWYLHNAMVHFCVPHGLEQTGGAAWGTRDVCQGPFELFLATGHLDLARAVLLAVFSHQQPDGDWPQWFMFDRYEDIHAGDSHGDVVLWPLKCLGDYLSASKDAAILDEFLPWLEGKAAPAALKQHLHASLLLLASRFIPGTDLLAYGGGDWDDTLQPARRELRSNMASTWTQALAYHTMSSLLESGLITDRLPASLADRLQNGFRTVWSSEGIPGFCLVEENGAITRMIAPDDSYTGIQYRLLPHTRSILAGLTTPTESAQCLEIIQKHLLAPDGAHLLNRATHYSGGNCKIFLRAEQAANVGREIGLQYVHAHIRYVQALAHEQHAQEAWNALLQITPPLLSVSVPNALPRQSNMYFSSSDADVPTRMAFEAQYTDILKGLVPVKGGWRLYSSGPGIWLARLLHDLLDCSGNSPMIPDSMDGLTVTIQKDGILLTKTYSAAEHTYSIQ